MSPALRPGTGTTFARQTEIDQRQLARGRDVYPGQRRVALPLPGGGLQRCFRSTPFSRLIATRASGPAPFSARLWVQRIIPRHESLTLTSTPLIRWPPVRLKTEGALEQNRHDRPVQYLEQRSGTGSLGDQATGQRESALPRARACLISLSANIPYGARPPDVTWALGTAATCCVDWPGRG